MDTGSAGMAGGTGVETTMVDLLRLDLADLEGLEADVLTESLRRLLRDASHPEETLAGFQSSI
ncbi:FXSXX-COOH protein [Frankia sp. CNm7]|uniref:FXSXX-COOH protein n=1 Tax=Frankia nepalensis TaxID=1836974 RepID=A0A937RCI2_9ACTN|nr:FxSxx-COOH cyclophane-containing RiPP peptide [Frankia nepalensis]MBL7498132.1 FXSXX-COOH protein [Frankia nepalensis]MBL7509350.1 FXSXX-COOH protein [Frankia nepalensis]MBL7516862.1 FXSXX-COOH protein [Frankia nepalensis]MBL7627920.1 FXSXX-COOH protein [Frankia nepalensis]